MSPEVVSPEVGGGQEANRIPSVPRGFPVARTLKEA